MTLHAAKMGCVLLAVAATVLGIAPTAALADAARVDGVVTDQSGRPLPGAIVHISWHEADTPSVYGDVLKTTCDSRGRFTYSGGDFATASADLHADQIFVEPADTSRWKIADFASSLDYNVLFDDLKLRRYARIVSCTVTPAGGAIDVGLIVDSGLLDVAVVGQNGQPLANSLVDVEPVADDIEINHSLVTRYEGRTDADGHVLLECPSSSTSYWVRVPGVGYATTGEVTVAAGKCSQVALPRLAPFGTISGKLPAFDIDGKSQLAMSVFNRDRFWQDIAPVIIGVDGQYSVRGLAAGETNLGVTRGASPIDTIRATALPGRIAHPLPMARPGLYSTEQWPQAANRLKLSGTVVDTRGRPIEGADVYIVGHSNGEITEANFVSISERCSATKTDSAGTFAFDLTTQSFDAGADIYAVQPGAPPAYCSIPAPIMRDAADGVETYSPVRLIVPAQSGTLDIHLIATGAATVQGLQVRIYRPDLSLTDWANDPQDEEAAAKAVRDAIEPKQLTDSNGSATFDNLAPGTYEVEVYEAAQSIGARQTWTELAVRSNVPVQQAASTPFSIATPSAAPPREWDVADVERTHQPPPVEAHPVEVHLQDANGKPTQGVVTIGEDYRLVAAGATDERGIVRFPGVPVGAWKITAISPKSPAPTRYGPAVPNVLPDDPARRSPVFDVITADSAKLHDRPVVLHEFVPAYITGNIRAKSPMQIATSTVTLDKTSSLPDLGATLDLEPKTGAYLYGPLAPGHTAFDLGRPFDGGASWDSVGIGVTQVTLRPGELKHLDLKQVESDADIAQESLSTLDLSHLTVYMPDGKTPAVGALVYGQRRGNDQPTYRAITNADGHPGRIAADENYRFDFSTEERTEVVAWLPGQCGPTAFRLPAGHLPSSLVLPRPRAVRGTATMHGKPALDQLGDIQLVAVCTDPPAIGSLCSARAPLDADGTFCLSGLLAGRSYLVQAILGYRPISAKVSIAGNSNAPIAIEINPPPDMSNLPVD